MGGRVVELVVGVAQLGAADDGKGRVRRRLGPLLANGILRRAGVRVGEVNDTRVGREDRGVLVAGEGGHICQEMFLFCCRSTSCAELSWAELGRAELGCLGLVLGGLFG